MTIARVLNKGPLVENQFAFDGSILVNKYDLMYHDTDDVKPASSQADGGTEEANQASFAPIFAGVSNDYRSASDGAVSEFPVLTDVLMEIDCTSATFEVGDKVTVVEASSGTALENQKVVKTSDETLAIGYAIKRYGSATTRVWVRLISRVLSHAPAPDVTAELTSATLPVIVFNGATGGNEIRVPANLADALSIEDSTGDLLVFTTTTGATAVQHKADKLGFFDTTPATQPAHIADPAATSAITATSPGSGADGTTPNGAEWAAAVVDLAALKTAVDANNAAIDSILSQLATLGLQAAS